MKKLFTLLMAITFISFGYAQTTLVDFEDNDVSFASWGSAGFAKVANPDASGLNVSDNVGEFTHDGSGGYIGIESAGMFENFDFTSTPYFRMKVWVDKPIEVIFKLQNNPNWGDNSELKYQVTAEETSQWIELAFNFGAVTATNYNRVVVYFDGGQALSAAGDKYYFDDIEKSDIPPPASITYNPENAETDVQVFANMNITSNFAMRMIDDSEITDLSTIAWLKKTSETGDDVAFSANINADKTVITIAPDQLLDPSTTYFYGLNDDLIEISATEVAVTGVSASFTTSDAAPTMEIYDDFDDTSLSVVVETMGDPDPAFSTVADPVDAENNVFKFEKNDTWGGWSRVHLELVRPIDMTGDHVYSMRVYSPVTTWVRLKIGNQKADGGNFKEKDADVNVVEGWQTLYFDFSGDNIEDTDFNHISIYFGGGDATPNVFYLDDITGPNLSAAPVLPAPGLPIDFEEGTVYNYTWSGFGAADYGAIPAAVIANPNSSGINTSGNVVEINKVAGAQTWAGASLNLDGAVDFTNGTIINIKAYSPRADVPVLLKMEDSNSAPDANGNPTVFVEVSATVTSSDTWETLEFDISTATGFDAANSYDRVIIFPDFDNVGAGELFYFDDIEFKEEATGFEELDAVIFNVYPNPASDYLFISNISNLKRIDIYSVTGQRIKTIETIENRIEISELPQGVYVISAESNSGEVFSTKFFKK